jgi:hypothetical protein
MLGKAGLEATGRRPLCYALRFIDGPAIVDLIGEAGFEQYEFSGKRIR